MVGDVDGGDDGRRMGVLVESQPLSQPQAQGSAAWRMEHHNEMMWRGHVLCESERGRMESVRQGGKTINGEDFNQRGVAWSSNCWAGIY